MDQPPGLPPPQPPRIELNSQIFQHALQISYLFWARHFVNYFALNIIQYYKVQAQSMIA